MNFPIRRPSASGMRVDTMTISNPHFSSETDQWATPQAVFDWLDEHFGPHDLDAAADSTNNKCDDYLSVEDDALSVPWSGTRVWLNPPYGRGLARWATKAIDEIVQAPNTLLEFSIRAITEGIDALGEVTVRVKAENGHAPRRTSPQSGRERRLTFGGHGADTDIIVASAKAYLAAINKLLAASGRYGTPEKVTEVAVAEPLP